MLASARGLVSITNASDIEPDMLALLDCLVDGVPGAGFGDCTLVRNVKGGDAALRGQKEVVAREHIRAGELCPYAGLIGTRREFARALEGAPCLAVLEWALRYGYVLDRPGRGDGTNRAILLPSLHVSNVGAFVNDAFGTRRDDAAYVKTRTARCNV